MKRFSSLKPSNLIAQFNDRRKRGRIKANHTYCELGEVVDLSASGMKVFRKGRSVAKDGDELSLTIENTGNVAEVDCRIVYIEKTGFRKQTYGIEFLNVDEDKRRQLVKIARLGPELITKTVRPI